MATHRHIQVHNIQDKAASKAAQCRRAAENLARIGNDRGAGHYLRRARRLDHIASICAIRLS